MQVFRSQWLKPLSRPFQTALIALCFTATWPWACSRDARADELDASQCTLDASDDARAADSAFAETPGTKDAADAKVLTPCGGGPGCTSCEHCDNGTCVALPTDCTADSDCGAFKYCLKNPGICKAYCQFVFGKCKQDSDCGPACAKCESNSCVDLYTGECNPGPPCPSGWYCAWDASDCKRKCRPYDGVVPDAADSDAPEVATSELPGLGNDAAVAADAKLDSAPVAGTATTPAPDSGCSAGRSTRASLWPALVGLAVLVVLGGRRRLTRDRADPANGRAPVRMVLVAALSACTSGEAPAGGVDGRLTACPQWQDQLGARKLVCATNLTCHYDAAQYCCKHAFPADCSCAAGGELWCNGPGAASWDWVCAGQDAMCSGDCSLGTYKLAGGCLGCGDIRAGYQAELDVLLAEHATCTNDDECGEVAMPSCATPGCVMPVQLGHEASLTASAPALLAKWCPAGFWSGPRTAYLCFVGDTCTSQGAKACVAGRCTWKPK